jgi:acetylornithine deacetylase/succinyl-diaminopimelate desuccinylase-like protein
LTRGHLSLCVLTLLASVGSVTAASPVAAPSPSQQLARGVLAEIIAIGSTHAHGSTVVAQAIAARLIGAGFSQDDVQVLTPKPDKGNVVVRMRGRGKARPVLFVAHLDVVEADPADWSVPPFRLTEKDGFFFGRGVIDIKDEVAILVADLIRLKKERFVPSRDIIVAFTSDEESGGDLNGVEWLLANRRDLIDAELVINPDSGGGDYVNGERSLLRFQTSEKNYATFQLETTNPGGHSSLPERDNAIYQLADGLARLSRFVFPTRLNETTRAYFDRLAAAEHGQVAADMKLLGQGVIDSGAVQRLSATPLYGATLHTTCVATMLQAGHAEAALPQRAQATVQCRLFPTDTVSDVQATLVQVLADPAIHVSVVGEPMPSPASPLRPDVLHAVERVTGELWPEVRVVPVMDPWASDSVFFRRAGIPSYGVSGVFTDVNTNGAHGRDERVGVQPFYEGVEFTYRLIRTLGR